MTEAIMQAHDITLADMIELVRPGLARLASGSSKTFARRSSVESSLELQNRDQQPARERRAAHKKRSSPHPQSLSEMFCSDV
jgi:hypothetical protein